MKKIFITLLSALAFAAAPKAKAEVSLDFFYDSLQDDGDWFEADDYGYCWQPRDVPADWSPYTDGYWTYTDAGWTWVSYESFGWATYHYGRWADIRGRGWVWVPGYEWGPAWVSWRSNDDYVGWAPLPARAALSVGISIGSDVDYDYDIGPSYYHFTSCSRFGSPSLRQVIVDRSENVTIINQTVNITNISYRDNIVYNGGPDYDRINRRSERPIERLKLERITQIDGQRDNRFNRRENGRLTVVAPPVVPVGAGQRPRNIKANLGKVQTENGWSGVRDPQLAQRTREKIKAENKGRTRGPVNNKETVAQALRSEARQKQVAVAPVQQANVRPQKRPAGNVPAAKIAGQPPQKQTPPSNRKPEDAAVNKSVPVARENKTVPQKPQNLENSQGRQAAAQKAQQNRNQAAVAEQKAATARQQANRERQQAAAQRENQVTRQQAQTNAARQQAARQANAEQAQADRARAQRQAQRPTAQREAQPQARRPSAQPQQQRPVQRPQAQPARPAQRPQVQQPAKRPAQPAKKSSDSDKKKKAEDDGR